MYINQNYYNAIAAGTRPVLAGTLGSYTIGEDDIMENSFQIDEEMTSLPIGGIITSCLTLVLNNFESKFDPSDLTTATIMSLTMTVGNETLTLPDYHIVDKKVANNTISLTLMDLTDTLATPPSINSPIVGATWADALENILDRLGLTYSTDTAAASKLAGTASIPVIYGQDTYKSVLLHILQYLNLFARISSGNDLYIFYPDPAATPIPVTGDMIASIDIEGPHTPTAVSVKAYNGEEYVTSGASGYTATLEGCPLIADPPDPSGYLAEVSALTFYNFNMDCIGDPSIQIGDYIKIDGTQLCLVGAKSYKFGGYENISFKWDVDAVDDFSYAQNMELDPPVADEVNEAKTMATNYLSADSTGIMVADLSDGQQTPSQATGRNVFIDDDSVDIRKGQTVHASFGTETVIGKSDDSRMNLQSNRFAMYALDSEEPYVEFKDVQTSGGRHYVDSFFVGDGTARQFVVNRHILDSASVSVTVDDEYLETTDYSVSNQTVTFTNAPASGARIVIHYRTNVPLYTFSMGEKREGASAGAYSFAQGNECVASGYASHAEGAGSEATSNTAHAEGYLVRATAESSHAEGAWTVASGLSSHAEGQHSEASGYASHAEGTECIASGDSSHAQNAGTIAASNYQTAIGRLNIKDNNGKYLFIIGNGSEGNTITRSNALTVDWDGTVELAGQLDFAKYRGVRLIDNANLQYYALYDTGNNFFLGYGGATTRHHKGNTYISSGHDGTSGNDTIYVAIPNAANNSATPYPIAHANNIEEVNTYGNGTYTLTDIAGYGYTVPNNSTDGYRLYVLIPLPKNAPTGKTITVTALTSTVIRGVNGVILNSTATSYVKSATALSNGLLRVYLTNLPNTNFVAHTPISIATNITFKVS